jgi:hypothetical protein
MRRPACRQNLNLRSVAEYLLCQSGCRLDDALAAIEHQQHASLAKKCEDDREGIFPGRWTAQAVMRAPNRRVVDPRSPQSQGTELLPRIREACRARPQRQRLSFQSPWADDRYQTLLDEPLFEVTDGAVRPTIRNGRLGKRVAHGDVASPSTAIGAGGPSNRRREAVPSTDDIPDVPNTRFIISKRLPK